MNEPASAGPIRLGRDADGAGFIALIRSCWSAYRGLRLDVATEMPELNALASYYGGALWVAEWQGRIAGMIAARPAPADVHSADNWEICRVYVDPALHGGGLAHALLDTAESHAMRHGASRLVLWTDTRFERAHAFYEKRSYVRAGGIRVLQDKSASLEFGYAKPIEGTLALDIAAAGSAERRLASILADCVDGGASVGFLPPLDPVRARAFWRRISTDVGAGKRVLLAGWRSGVLVGTVMLDLDTPDNQPHRAEVQKLLVHPSARRSGLGRELMHAAAYQAGVARRTLLTLDTRAGDAAEALYRDDGWHEAGRIPGYALDRSGRARDTVLFWKGIGA